jgi:choline dehydrogenase
VLPVFRKSENYFRGADEAHGADGEWRVEPQRLRWDILDSYREAMVQVGIPAIDDFNRGDNEGCSYFLVNQTRGVRLNTSRAFLRPVMNRPNLSVMTEAHVKRLTFEGRRCTGVELMRGGRDEKVTARIDTILAAGSIGSPQILQLSGGRARCSGIPFCTVAGRRREPAGSPQLRSVHVQNVAALSVRQPVGKGDGAEYVFRSVRDDAPVSTGSRASTPNVEIHTQPLSLEKFTIRCMSSTPSSSICNLRSLCGYVTARSAAPHCRHPESLRTARLPSMRWLRALPRSRHWRSSLRVLPAEFQPTKRWWRGRQHRRRSSSGQHLQDGLANETAVVDSPPCAAHQPARRCLDQRTSRQRSPTLMIAERPR